MEYIIIYINKIRYKCRIDYLVHEKIKIEIAQFLELCNGSTKKCYLEYFI